MGNARLMICFAVAIFVMMTVQGFADMYLQDGGTYNITTEILVPVYVDLVMPENPTTVNILDGANLYCEPVSIQCNNSAHLNISGGRTGYLKAYDNSSINMSEGYVEMAYTFGDSNTIVSGGILEGLVSSGDSTAKIYSGDMYWLDTNDTSTVNISNVYVENAFAYGNSKLNLDSTSGWFLRALDNSTVNICSNYSNGIIESGNNSIMNISGGGIDASLCASGNSTMNLTGASFDSGYDDFHTHLSASGNSTVNITEGSLTGFIRSRDTSTVNIYSGSFGRVDHGGLEIIRLCGGLYALDNSTMNIFGGEMEYLSASGNSILYISGGGIGELYALDSSDVVLNGYDFGFGNGLSWGISGKTILGTGILSGKWFDGTNWTISIVQNDTNATIMAVTDENVIYVDLNSPRDPGSGTYGDPYRYIQTAINDSNDEDIIVIAAGTYTGDGNKDIDFQGKAITVKGETGDPCDVIIDCNGSNDEPHRGFKFHSGEDANSVLEGLTIKNGVAPDETQIDNFPYCGGGICILYSGPTINNCRIIQNTAGHGGAIYCQDSNVTINNCLILGNRVDDLGGAIYCKDSNTILKSCIISENHANAGGAIYCKDSNVILKNCSILDNRADWSFYSIGGGFYGDNSNTIIDNCKFIGNVARESGAAIYGCDGIISNCIIRNNRIPWEGRGGAISNCSGLIKNCLIEGNYSNWGDGAGISGSSADIVSCVIRNNINTSGSGDVMSVTGGGLANCNGNITNCIIANNRSVSDSDAEQPSRGGGLAYCNGTITNCVIYGNEAYNNDYGSEGGGIYKCTGTIKNCIIWRNTTDQIYDSNASYCDIQGGWSGIGNINLDPCFVDLDSNDFHLKSEAGRWDSNLLCWVSDEVTSPCIDSGDIADSNWMSEPWPHGRRINIGAYGGTSQASMSNSNEGNIADMDNSGIVDFKDYCILAGDWYGANSHTISKGQIDVDGNVIDWSDNTEWMNIDKVYFGDPCDIIQAKFALRWNPGTDKLYVAVIIEDAKHVFTDGYQNWSASDRIELFSQGDAAGGNYIYLQDIAQQYIMASDTKGGSWATLGFGEPNISPTGFEYAVKVKGDFIIYEAGIKQFDNYGGISGGETVVTELNVDGVVRFDIAADTRWSSTGFGMLSENRMPNKFRIADNIAQYKLVEETHTPSCLELKGDLNKDCVLDWSDMMTFCNNWLEGN